MKSPNMRQKSVPFFHLDDGFFLILLTVSPSGHFATEKSRRNKEFEGSPVRTWKRQMSFLARPLGV